MFEINARVRVATPVSHAQRCAKQFAHRLSIQREAELARIHFLGDSCALPPLDEAWAFHEDAGPDGTASQGAGR